MVALRAIAQEGWERFKDVGERVQSISEKAKSVDVVIKAVEKTLHAADYIIHDSTADEATKASVRKAHHFLADARKVTSFFNVFMGVIPSMAKNIKAIGKLVKSLVVPNGCCSFKINEDDCFIPGREEKHDIDSVKINDPESRKYFKSVVISVTDLEEDELGEEVEVERTYERPIKFSVKIKMGNEDDDKTYHGTTEKVLGLITEFFNLVAGLSYTVCFGILRPTSLVGRFTELGARAKSMASKFPHFIAVNHAASFVATSADLIREGHVYLRSGANYKAFKRLMDKIETGALSLSEKFCELGADAITLGAGRLRGPTGQMPSPWGGILIAFNAGIVIIGLVRVVKAARAA